MNSEIKYFLLDVESECKEHKIHFKLINQKTVEVQDGIRCAGYFDHLGKEIVIAKNNELWLGNLVHEFCHMQQWIEQSDIWRKEAEFGTYTFDKWLMGRRVSNLRKSVNNLIRLELDCERRAVDKIIKYDLPINVVTYIQRANEVLLYYRYLYETKADWSNGNLAAFEKMPKRFMSESYYIRKLSDKNRKIFIDQNL